MSLENDKAKIISIYLRWHATVRQRALLYSVTTMTSLCGTMLKLGEILGSTASAHYKHCETLFKRIIEPELRVFDDSVAHTRADEENEKAAQ